MSQPAILRETLLSMVRTWAKIARTKESAFIWVPSKGESWWRWQDLIADMDLYAQEFPGFGPPHLFDADSLHVLDGMELQQLFLSLSGNGPIVIVGAESWFQVDKQEYLLVLQEVAIRRTVFACVSINVFDQQYEKVVRRVPALMEYFVIHPLYSPSDSEQFIRYMAERWNLQVDKKISDEIIAQCGGSLWLIKQALRHLMSLSELPTGDWLWHSEMRWRLEALWQQFSSSDQQAFLDGTLSDFLIKCGWSHFPLFERFVNEKKIAKWIWHLNGDQIYCNDLIMDDRFSPRELKLMRLLLLSKGKLVERVTIGETIWGSDYTDWTLDRLVSRLRLKLQRLHCGEVRFEVVRGRGLVWEK